MNFGVQRFVRISLFLFLTVAPSLAQSSTDTRGIRIAPRQYQSFHDEVKVALVVDVDNYPNGSGFANLKFAVEDAKAVAAELKSQGYIVRTLLNAEAVRTAIRQALKDSDQVLDQRQGTFVFFFAGHGGQQKDKEGGQFLATYESGIDSIVDLGLPLKEVQETIAALRAPRKMMFVDACRNEAAVGASRSNEQALRSFASLENERGLHLLNSTAPGQFSFEDPELGHGVFTHFLLKGIHGEAAGADGLVTFRRLADYMNRSMREFTFSKGHLQTPFEGGDASGDFLLAGSLIKAPVVVLSPEQKQQVTAAIDEGRQLANTGKHREPIAAYKNALELQPDPADTFLVNLSLISSLDAVEDWAEVIRACDQALELLPSGLSINIRDTLYHAKWGALMRSGDPGGAALAITEDLQLNLPTAPKRTKAQTAELYEDRGRAFFEAEQFPKAVEDFSSALQLAPDNPELYLLRGNASRKDNNDGDARRDIDEAIRLKPDFDIAYYARGEMLSGEGDNQAAIRDLSEAIRTILNFPAPIMNALAANSH